MLNQLTESFARHVDAFIQREPGGLPGIHSSLQDMYVLVPGAFRASGGAFANTVAIVTKDHGHILVWNKSGKTDFEPAVWERDHKEQVPRAVLPKFAHVEKGKFLRI